MPPITQQLQLLLTSIWPPKVASAIILMLIGWWTYANVLPLFEENEMIAAQVSTTNKTKAATKQPIKNLDLFGTPEKAKSAKVSKAKQTKLNLTLRGILAFTDDPSQGYAQIENTKKVERYFAVKDKIFGLATLEEIYVDRVIILHNGKYETLKLPEKFLNSKHFMATKRKQEQKKIVTDLRKLLVNRKAMELIKGFGFDTAYKNGGFYGFSIKVVGENGQAMIDTLGVKEGDVIVAVNGERFAESIEAVNNLVKLKTAKSVNVEIDRNGTTLFFDIDFDESVPLYDSPSTPAAKEWFADRASEKEKAEEKAETETNNAKEK